MAWRAHIAEGLRPVVDLVYPPRCPSCGEAIAAQGGLCVECWSLLEVPADGEVDASAGAAVVYAATRYNDTSRKLTLAFKHGGKIALAPLLARLMAAKMPDHGDEKPLLIPVPLHRIRLWQRGFNQSALLARELERLGKGKVLIDGLRRCKRTPSLGGLGAVARRKALQGAIIARRGAEVKIANRNVILIDDVLTSGATSDACIEALQKAGARSVALACFATASS